MAKKPPKAAPAVVSRILTDAYHSKAVTSTTRIRGWHNTSPGFRCRKGDEDGVCLVFFRSSDLTHGREMTAKRVAEYRTTLEPYFTVELKSNDCDEYLRVTTKA